MNRAPRRAPIVLLGTLVTGCGGADDPDVPPPTTLQEAVESATQALQTRDGGGEPMSAEVLQARLPERLAGLPRVESERTQTGVMGMQLSVVTARYESEDRRRLTVSITDVSGLGAQMAMGLAAWSIVDFDRTTSGGYERTGRFEGFKTMESFGAEGGIIRTELNVLVADRFIVKLTGQEVEMDTLKDAARAMDLTGLARSG